MRQQTWTMTMKEVKAEATQGPNKTIAGREEINRAANRGTSHNSPKFQRNLKTRKAKKKDPNNSWKTMKKMERVMIISEEIIQKIFVREYLIKF